MEKNLKTMNVFAKTGRYGIELSYTNGKEFFKVKFREECLIKPNKVGYWTVVVDANLIDRPKPQKATANGFTPNRVIWITKDNLVSVEYNEAKNAEYEAKRLADINDLFE